MALKVGLSFIKYSILLISFMYVLTSAVLATIGGTIMDRFSIKYFFEQDFMTVGKLLFFTGLIVLFISLLGIIGATRESTLLINIFGGLMVLMVLIEILSLVLVNKGKEDAIGLFDYLYYSGMQYYFQDEEMKSSYDYLQKTFGCCGRETYTEWSEMPSETNPLSTIPESCCAIWQQTEDNTSVAMCERYYSNGCISQMMIFLNKRSTCMGITAIITAQLAGVVLIFILAKAIRNAKTVREMERWQHREQIAAQGVQRMQKEDIHPKGIIIPTTEDSTA